MSSFHIDHVLPESLAGNPAEFEATLIKLGLGREFDLRGWENLLPCSPGANLQKSAIIFDPAHIHFFLGIAAAKKPNVITFLKRIELRKSRGRAILLLTQCLERGELSADEVSGILHQYEGAPEAIFELLEGIRIADAEEIRVVARSEIESLRDRPLWFGPNREIEGITLVDDANKERLVRTCREYEEAVADGFYALTSLAMKVSSWIEHHCGLLNWLQHASAPSASFISDPRRSILDLNLIPYSFFPQIGGLDTVEELSVSYQDKVDEGSLVIRRVSNNLVKVVQPRGMGQQLVEVARADFNGDGLEDILVFEYCFATEGTLGYGSVRIITRSSPTSMFEMVSSPVSRRTAERHDA